MYIISDNDLRKSVYSALSSQTREFRQRLSFGEGIGSRFNKQISFDAGIKKIEISQVGNADNNGLVLGNCCSSSATVEFYNPRNTYRYNDKTMFVECGIKLEDGEYFYIPCGYYKVEKPETDDDWKTVKITAYDVVDEMSDKWNTSLTMPTTSYLLIKEIADKYNLELEIDPIILSDLQKRQITESEASMLTAYKEREVVGFLVGCLGGNARVNTVGKLYVGIYNPFPQEIINIETNVQWQNGFKKTLETEFEIASITSGVGDDVFTAGTGKGLTFVNPLITEEEIAEIYENYGGFTFQPSACEWRGNPCVECGDVVFVFDKSGNYYTVFVARQDIDLTGGLSMTTHCPGGDSDVSFDTLNDEIRQALNKQYTYLQQAIVDATNKINGALGGYYEVLDSDNDGNPDGWLIKEFEDGHGGLIRANKSGIGLSEDGGKTYRTAITYKGINADEITSGKVKAEFIETDKLVVGMGNVTGLDTELQALLNATEEADNKAVNAQTTANTANATATTTNLILGGLTAQENGVTVIKGSTILTGSIGAAQIASGAITAEKLDAKAITAEKVNVGWQSGNCATGWTSDKESYITITSDSAYNYNPKITLSSSYTSGNIDVNGIPFYASAGDVLRFGGRAYKKSTGDNGIYLKYSEKSDGTYNVVSYQNTANNSTGATTVIDKSYTVTQAGWYMITVAFNTQTSGAYVTNLYCYKNVKGEMIVNGIIKSVDGNTYFDLNNSKFVADNDSGYSTELTSGGIISKYQSNISGGFQPLGVYGFDSAFQFLWFSKYFRIGKGEPSNNDPFLDCAYDRTFATDCVSFYKQANFLDAYFSKCKNIKSGKISAVTTSGTSVTFDEAFINTPYVVCTAIQANSDSGVGISATLTSVSKSGFTVRTNVASGSWGYGSDVYWIAIDIS